MCSLDSKFLTTVTFRANKIDRNSWQQRIIRRQGFKNFAPKRSVDLQIKLLSYSLTSLASQHLRLSLPIWFNASDHFFNEIMIWRIPSNVFFKILHLDDVGGPAWPGPIPARFQHGEIRDPARPLMATPRSDFVNIERWMYGMSKK